MPSHQELLFTEYRSISTRQEQREYLHSLLIIGTVQRRRVNSPQKIRSRSVQYNLVNETRNKIRVCRLFFCNTFGISTKVLENISKKTSPTTGRYRSEHGNTGKTPAKTTPQRIIRKVAQFISRVPKLPSHYSRANSSRLYLEAT